MEDNAVSGKEVPDKKASAGGLQALLEVERRIQELVALREEEAARVLETARAHAHELEESAGASLAEALERVRADIERHRDAVLDEIEAGADAQVARYQKVPPETLGELARWLAWRLVGTDAGAGKKS
jgi:vacuolar-type H+-ATPase subunit H